ncbi:MAG: glycine dehydrogenase (aminomethyl-transferring) [Elusimicrobia bacterium GWA2_69_24]|nr:MAG: glycine dehydrogenase (aminomethyl-transferring) [Elusimicrobia bacterium GWA2_69_24]HBL15539.1 glycine dehydrogenase (aminomethyl-transferring) [Elusimicrobiota bacterium]
MPTLTQHNESSGLDLAHPDVFADRHIGPSPAEIGEMLQTVGAPSLEALMDAVIPQPIRSPRLLDLGRPMSELEVLDAIREITSQNEVYRSFIGAGYQDCVTPSVLQRNILEDPGWYTQYTPYQPEISQGRLEALLNFQTMVCDLSGLPVANASLLDEATAAAEAMAMARAHAGGEGKVFFAAADCHPQTLAVLRTRAWPLGIEVVTESPESFDFSKKPFGVLVQNPSTDGVLRDVTGLAAQAHETGALLIVAADLLSLALLRPPGECGADIALGSTQRFGVPMGYGGPHAAYFAVKDELKRIMPGRIVGVSRDSRGQPALRLALQTREQHIRREKATSNICTSQALVAILASMYAVYHGPESLRRIATRVRRLTLLLAAGLRKMGYQIGDGPFFDTLRVPMNARRREEVLEQAEKHRVNLRAYDDGSLGVALDEKTSAADLKDLLTVFAGEGGANFSLAELVGRSESPLPPALERKSAFLTHAVFSSHHSETQMLRYIQRLRTKDLSLAVSMIPLGSCTMKLNATTEMLPITWRKFAALHPFAPLEQAKGYRQMFKDLEKALAEITGMAAVSLQPNAGAQGEYAGLLVIRKYHACRGQAHRRVCLIPQSAHGTNPASAAMAGLSIVVVACDAQGNIDVADLKRKAAEHARDLAALMVTYPSTHGVFEESIREICEAVHAAGGQVYLDGANLNAQVGWCRPGEYGADVCHLNLHKTFALPHGGGGPGIGPIAVAKHLAPHLPAHFPVRPAGKESVGLVSASPWGSASILPIAWMYVKMMGGEGLRRATAVAVLNANYVAKRLEKHYPVVYKGKSGFVAHECIVDPRPLKAASGVGVEDIARRLMDYGFHAPTISFPVVGTMMIEPTESEDKAQLDEFVDALIAIHGEIRAVAEGKSDKEDNPLRNAPHTADQVAADDWKRPYSRELGAFPTAATRAHKFWPAVSKIDNPYGDRNFVGVRKPGD